MSESTKAIFLSYASPDAEAVQRICDALRAAGLQVWFDRNELRGGDAWDASIRKQIKECALFIPVISANTNARSEGYFRLEWKLAIDRSHLMADDQAFLLPVVIDDTSEAMARVPDRFRERQWSRLARGETPAAFAERVKRLLSGSATTATAVSNAKPVRRSRLLIAVLIIVAAATAAGFYISSHRSGSKAPPSSIAPAPPAIPEKSIAVLPFENLSRDPDNAYFATGIQDEILTRLAKVGSLKVISRTSTQQYDARPGNLSEIARQPAVANILEGTVQKAGDQVHVNVQLIRASTDEHLWAESYNRKLENIFGVEGEVAAAVAEAMKAKLTGAAQQALAQKPTSNPEAYDAYLRGLAYSLRPGYSFADNLDAIRYFNEAVKLDPKFALAWAWLGRENALAYFNALGNDVPALREAAKRAAETAIELQPDLGEAYLAQGYSHYYGDRDYGGAITLFEKAGQLSPNNSQVPFALALICRRLGEWQRSLDYFRQALELDPRNVALIEEQADTLGALRQYPAALKAWDQMLDIQPDNSDALAGKANIYQSQGNLAAAAALLSALHPHPGPSYPFRVQINQWTYERRYAEGIAVLKAVAARPDPTRTVLDKEGDNIYIKFELAWFQQLAGEAAATQTMWRQVRSELENYRRSKREDMFVWELASASIALGDKAKAFTIVEHAAALLPTKDAMAAAGFLYIKAMVAVEAGEKDLAIQQLAISAQNPDGADYGDLKLNPLWDPLRGDPRFEKIVASLAPK